VVNPKETPFYLDTKLYSSITYMNICWKLVLIKNFLNSCYISLYFAIHSKLHFMIRSEGVETLHLLFPYPGPIGAVW